MYDNLKKLAIDKPHSYSCVMLQLPSDITAQVINWGKENIDDDDLYTEAGPDSVAYDGFGREDDPHITLLYGLHTENIDEVKAVLADEGAIKFKLGKITLFDNNPDYSVVKVDVSGIDLHRINKKLKKLDYTNDYPDYKPHITIAYVKKGKEYKGELEVKDASSNKIKFSVPNANKFEFTLGINMRPKTKKATLVNGGKITNVLRPGRTPTGLNNRAFALPGLTNRQLPVNPSSVKLYGPLAGNNQGLPPQFNQPKFAATYPNLHKIATHPAAAITDFLGSLDPQIMQYLTALGEMAKTHGSAIMQRLAQAGTKFNLSSIFDTKAVAPDAYQQPRPPINTNALRYAQQARTPASFEVVPGEQGFPSWLHSLMQRPQRIDLARLQNMQMPIQRTTAPKPDTAAVATTNTSAQQNIS